MDISNVIYLFKKKFIDKFFFYSTLKSIFFGDFTKACYRLYCQKRVAILKKIYEIIIKIYVLDIPKYSFIILYSDDLKKNHMLFFLGTLMTTEK